MATFSEYPSYIREWIHHLNENFDLDNRLNQVFDGLKFDQDYLNWNKNNSPQGRITAIKDRVWGMIELDLVSGRLVDCPLFQRLRSISQLGFSYLTYPTARHSRFEHSLGVYYVVNRLLESFEVEAARFSGVTSDKPVRIEKPDSQLLLHAALLHDIGHAPNSHATEKIYELYQEDRTIGKLSIAELFASYEKICSRKGLKKNPSLSELVSVLIVTSQRYQQFYNDLVDREELPTH